MAGRDLVYEAMVMRSGHYGTRKKDVDSIVGGGILEKQLNLDLEFAFDEFGLQHESRGERKEIGVRFIANEKLNSNRENIEVYVVNLDFFSIGNP